MWSRQSAGTRPSGPGTGWSAGRLVGGSSSGPSPPVSLGVVPEPVLAGLEALDDGWPDCGEVRGGVLGGGGVAAADVAALDAAPQVHPPAAVRFAPAQPGRSERSRSWLHLGTAVREAIAPRPEQRSNSTVMPIAGHDHRSPVRLAGSRNG